MFDNVPVAPGRSLGYPGRPTGKFFEKFGFFEKIGFCPRIFLDFKPKNAKNHRIFEEPARSGIPELEIYQKSIKQQTKIH